MNLLTRITSNKSTTDAKESSTSTGKSVSTELSQDQSKPSLFRRLSIKRSASTEGPGQNHVQAGNAKEKEAPLALSGENQRRDARKHAVPEDLDDKTLHPTVAEIPPDVAQHDANDKHVKKSDAMSAVNTATTTPMRRENAHPALSGTPDTPQQPSSLQSPPASQHESGLTKDDVQHLFSGAPQYILEKGRRGRYFPQSFFPWNADLETSDLQDRRHLRHESFALSTLHAHLPIRDEVNWKPGMAPPVKKEGLDTGKRPMFELGIFERPNMLGVEGREPGTVGMRHFLERPVADGIQDEKIKEHGKDVEIDLALANAPAMEAFKMLAIKDRDRDKDEVNAKIGKHAPALDRGKLIREGPHAWKAVGVRDISMKDLAERLEMMCFWRDNVVNAGWRVTVLNKMNSSELSAHLFGELLYPPRKMGAETYHDQEKAALKVQIEALVKVLTTPGAWLDLSVPEARLRFGKILHSRTTRHDHVTGTLAVDPERKWLLIQLLLAVELVVRLDAALRMGIALHSDNFEISSEEIHHFNKLRNLKVDWDLVAARRFLFLCYVKKVEKEPRAPSPTKERPPNPRYKTSPEHHGLFSSLLHTLGLGEQLPEMPNVYDVAILPRQPKVMVDGIFRFAEYICWPRSEEVKARLHEKLCKATLEERERFLMDAVICTNNAPDGQPPATSDPTSVTPVLSTFSVDLHAATDDTIGGWLSHSWLSGMILPGQSICDILMSTLLENDTSPATLADLGSTNVPLRSAGFILNGSSWWSKSSILGRVLAPMRGSKESMGWVYTPNFVPLYESTNSPIPNRWIKVKTYPVPTDRDRPRIFDGDKLAMESTPLGMGKGAILGSEFSMVTDHVLDDQNGPEVRVQDIRIHLSSISHAMNMSPDLPLSARAQLDLIMTYPSAPDSPIPKQIQYRLERAVYFVCAHPCRLPPGHATFRPGTSDADYEQHHPRPKTAEHIPAHPLHKTYKFVTKTLADLIDNPRAEPPRPGFGNEVWVVDARQAASHAQTPSGGRSQSETSSISSAGTVTSPGSESSTAGADPQLWEKDILVRAWCAEKGRNAIIARVGRTCLSCAIREAKALEIAVIVRVGVKE